MITRFEELDWQTTPIGDLTLRRRTEPAVGQEIYEVKLGDEYLMSSLFTVAEEELANLLADTLDPVEQAAVADHVDECADCQKGHRTGRIHGDQPFAGPAPGDLIGR